MKILRTVADLAAWRATGNDAPGFVPTMGALHAGHLALVQRSLNENARTLVSIFVNPTQFDQAADQDTYPSTQAQDCALLESAGVDAVWLPAASELYPDDYRFRVTETACSATLCGAHRPGHFDGVLTVVMKLLNAARPGRAYFGEKDYQQLALVRDMAAAFFLSVDVVACPTIREPDGLALSSRNRRLGPADRQRAPLLHRTLCRALDARSAAQALECEGFEVDYVEDRAGRRLAAVRLGDVRLIDNVSLEQRDEA